MAPYIGYDSDTAFIPGTLNTSSSLTIQGGGITQTGGDVNFDSATLFIDEDLNRVGIGTSTPTTKLDVFVNGGEGLPTVVTGERMRVISNDIAGRSGYLSVIAGSSAYSGVFFGDNSAADIGKIRYYHADNSLQFLVNGTTEGLRITSAGNVGIGTTNPAALLDVQGNAYIGKTDSTYSTRVIAGSGSYAQQEFYNGATRQLVVQSRGDISYSRIVSDNWLLDLATASAQPILFTINGGERARIDSSGRLLIGTVSSLSDHFGSSGTQLQIAGTSYPGSSAQLNAFGTDQFLSPFLVLNKARGTQVSPLSVVNNDRLGGIVFTGYAASTPNQLAARIECYVDGDPETAGDTSDLPGRLVFSTTTDGASSPTERLRITSAGSVGIGTINPQDTLHVTGTIRTNSGGNYAQFANNFLRANAAGTFFFDQSTVGQSFNWRTSSASALDTTALVITSAGNVGIGTTNPVVSLNIQSSNTDTFRIQSSGATTLNFRNDTLGGILDISNNSSVIQCRLDARSGFSSYVLGNFLVGSFTATGTASQPLQVTGGAYISGKLGIGTTTVASGEQVQVVGGGVRAQSLNAVGTPGAFAATGGLIAYHNGSGVGILRAYSDAGGGSGTLILNASGSEDARINSSGNVGIGTTNPSTKLHLLTSSIGSGIHIANSYNGYPAASTGYSDIRSTFYDYLVGGSTFGGESIIRFGSENAYSPSRSAYIAFLTSPANGTGAATEKVRITSAGNVGIGTDNPGTKLDVIGDIRSSTALRTIKGQLADEGGGVLLQTTGYLRINNGNSEYIRLNSSGSVGIGTTNPTSKLAVNGLITESTDNAASYHNVVTAQDIGTAPNQVPINAYLGTLAFQDSDSIVIGGATIATTTSSYLWFDNSQNTGAMGLRWRDENDVLQTEFEYDMGLNKQFLRVNGNGFQVYSKQSSSVILDMGANSGGYNNVTVPNGSVGIGTDNPDGQLTIKKQILISDTISNTVSHLSLVSDGGGSNPHQSVIHFGPRNASTNSSPAAIAAIASGNTASDLAFYVNSNNNYSSTPNTEVLRISNSGNVGINTYPADSLDILGGFRVQGNIRTKNYYKTGTTSEQQYTLRDTLANSAFEADPFCHPFLMNDLASFIARGGSYAFGGLTSTPGGLEQLFSTQGHVYFANSWYSGSTFTITLTNLPRGLNFGTYFGITFGSASFSPSSCKIETSTDGGGNWTTRLDHTGSQFNYFTKVEVGGTAVNAIRYTIGQGNSGGIRIQSLWAFNYNSHGMEHYFMPRSGGQLYGNMSFPSGNGINFSATSDAGGMTSELLDDYEEGTWTPVLNTYEGDPGPHSYTITSAKYRKVGSIVYLSADVKYTGTTKSFRPNFTGLPYTGTGYTNASFYMKSSTSNAVGYNTGGNLIARTTFTWITNEEIVISSVYIAS